VTPITTGTDTPSWPIRVGDGPWSIAITPNGKTAYVINRTSHTVTPITTDTNAPGKPIKVGNGAWSMVTTP
jgi:DNA-binding beta-propeller fold protein YncE